MPKAKALFTELVENYCVDLSRVYGTGHSYGAGGMLMSLMAQGHEADFDHFDFKGVAPVAGWGIWNQSTKVSRPPPNLWVIIPCAMYHFSCVRRGLRRLLLMQI